MARLFMIVLLSCIIKINSEGNQTFIATKDWQVIKNDQAIPQGLHVRINLQTGLKEAKLIDDIENEEKPKSNHNSPLSVIHKDLDAESEEKQSIKRLEKALKNIPTTDFKLSEEEIKQIKTKFKTYDIIKNELKDADMAVKTDGEIIDNLIKRYTNISSSAADKNKEIDLIIEDLEYLTHQIDNSLNFIASHGIEKIIIPNLVNQTNVQRRIDTLRLLGSLLNNNAKAKVAVLKSLDLNIGSKLIDILASSKNTQEISTCIFAFGSLLRRFPLAQQTFIPKRGGAVLVDIITRQEGLDLKTKIKALILIADLIRDFSNFSEEDELKKNQYKLIDTENIFKNLDFCQKSSDFFVKNRKELTLDADQTEKVIQSFLNLRNCCEHLWVEDAMFRHTLLVIKSSFENKFHESNKSDEFASDILNLIEELNNFLYKDLEIVDELYANSPEISNKDEL